MEDERVVLSLNVQPDGPRYLVRLDKLFFAGRKNEKNAVSYRVYITFPSRGYMNGRKRCMMASLEEAPTIVSMISPSLITRRVGMVRTP